MILRKVCLLASVLCGITIATLAQDVLENNAPSLKWMQLETPDFKIIFPQGFDAEAQRVANTLQTLHEPQVLGDKPPKKISVILRNRQAISNGFVTLGPRRSEFYTMPSQDNQFLGTNEWLDLLSVHEYRHIAQFQQSKSGFNKLFYYLFGENTQAGMAFSAAPPWFWEGDATLIETTNTRSGRGRIPAFSRVFKTNLLRKKKFSYNKQHLRSFKDFIPDHYKLGYYFVSHIRRRTGDPEIWDKVTKSAWSWPFVPFTFSNALKKHTGYYLVDNYDQMMEDVKGKWQEQIEGLDVTPYNTINRRRTPAYADYSYPQVLEDGSVVVFKEGIGDVGQLVKFSPEGKEQDRFITGVMNQTGMLDATQHKVVWNEYHFDARWRAETYSVIKMYDFYTGQLSTLTEKSRYAGAALSPDGYLVATTETDIEGNHSLVVLDTYSGKVKRRFPNPDNDFYSMPRWSENGREIVYLKTDEAGRSVEVIDYETGETTVLIAPGTENIGYPVLYDKYLFYNSPYNGIDNIYVLDRLTKQRYQVTNSRYGAYNATVKAGNMLVYNEHTTYGLDVVERNFNKEEWVPLSEVQDRSIRYYEPLVKQEGHAGILKKVPDNEYPVKKYSK
ncbi:MAG: hypothetical protein R3345_09185, partial [Fulvivirga sp.]|nr:hypothetical protein [Fulvivirga sp.]